MNEIDVSVIIPFYNTPLDIFKKCVDCLINQTYKKIEIIIIDDGSMERISTELEELYGKVSKILIFHIKNSGVSVARNVGISIAKGRTICFVDSDDYCAPWMIEDLFSAYSDNNASAVVSYLKPVADYEFIFTRNNNSENNVSVIDKSIINEAILRGLNVTMTELGVLSCGPCAILVDKKIAECVKFPVGYRYMEDVIWNYQAFMLAGKVVKLNETVYAYVMNQNSATHKVDVSIIGDRLMALKQILLLTEKHMDLYGWYALRAISNYSIICEICARLRNASLICRIRNSYEYSLNEVFEPLKDIRISRKWELKYKIKHYLFLCRLLPLVYFFRYGLRKRRSL